MSPRERIGVPGGLACLVAVVLLAVLLAGWRSAFALALALGLAALFHPAALAVARSRMAWGFALVLLVSGALWLGPADARLGPVPYSTAGLALGTWMALRGWALLVAFRGFAATVSPAELAGLLERAGLRGLGFTFGVAVNLLPALERSAARTWDTIRLRGGLRRRRRAMLQLGAVTIVANALRRADNVAIAAETRGVGLRRARPLPLRRGRLDAPLAAALAVVAAALIAWR
jgi:energy-coupling factor transporter transmembrane protein EcfT